MFVPALPLYCVVRGCVFRRVRTWDCGGPVGPQAVFTTRSHSERTRLLSISYVSFGPVRARWSNWNLKTAKETKGIFSSKIFWAARGWWSSLPEHRQGDKRSVSIPVQSTAEGRGMSELQADNKNWIRSDKRRRPNIAAVKFSYARLACKHEIGTSMADWRSKTLMLKLGTGIHLRADI